MLMHLIKLLCCSCTFEFSIPMLISDKINRVNFKPPLLCQFQTSIVLSISNPCSRVSQFQFVFAIQFVPVNGQVTSSHPRTACACQFAFIFGQVTSSHPRTACTCQFAFIPVIGQVTSSNTRTACTCALCLLSAKRLVQLQKNSLCPSTCQFSRSSSQFEPRERLVPVNLLSVSPVNFVICYLVNVYQSRNGYDIPCYLLSC